jgi:pimeloyl-ACP methyl ester carboxylesterase
MRLASRDAAFWIERLALRPHPEGGWFRETYRAPESIDRTALPARYDGARAFATAIYFLLASEDDSRYTPEFVATFRDAQRARCARLDERARAWCEEAAHARRRLGSADEMAALAPAARAEVKRRALQRRYFVIYRTLADPRYLDRSLDPSERALGSIFSFGRDPIVANYGEGLARAMSARGWLSTWSGLASNAALERTLPGVAVPTMVITALADTDIYPDEGCRAFAAAGARDKTYHELSGADHYLRPVMRTGSPGDPRAAAAEMLILPWLRARWPL